MAREAWRGTGWIVPEIDAEGARTTIKHAVNSPKFSVFLMHGQNSSLGRERAGEKNNYEAIPSPVPWWARSQRETRGRLRHGPIADAQPIATARAEMEISIGVGMPRGRGVARLC